MAIQDVIILPGYENGITLRVYNPNTRAWDVAYCFTGKIIRLEARKEKDMIVLTNIEDKRRKWVFVKIEEDYFHWQDVTVKEDAQWHILFDLYAASNEHNKYRNTILITIVNQTKRPPEIKKCELNQKKWTLQRSPLS